MTDPKTDPTIYATGGPPKWRLVANLADPERVEKWQEAINVYVDTGTDLPEIEFIERTEHDWEDDNGEWQSEPAWLVSRFAMPKHTCHNLTGGGFGGGLYPNLDDDKAIKDRALGGDGCSASWGNPPIPIQTMVEWFTSDDPLERAKGYMALAEVYTASEFDYYRGYTTIDRDITPDIKRDPNWVSDRDGLLQPQA